MREDGHQYREDDTPDSEEDCFGDVGFMFDGALPKTKRTFRFGDISVSVRLVDGDPGAVQSGHYIWPGAPALSAYLVDHRLALFPLGGGGRCLELGAGCGLAGLVAAQLQRTTAVVFTDHDPGVLDMIRESIDEEEQEQEQEQDVRLGRSEAAGKCRCVPLSWGPVGKQQRALLADALSSVAATSPSQRPVLRPAAGGPGATAAGKANPGGAPGAPVPAAVGRENDGVAVEVGLGQNDDAAGGGDGGDARFDLVIASDVIYSVSVVEPLFQAVSDLLVLRRRRRPYSPSSRTPSGKGTSSAPLGPWAPVTASATASATVSATVTATAISLRKPAEGENIDRGDEVNDQQEGEEGGGGGSAPGGAVAGEEAAARESAPSPPLPDSTCEEAACISVPVETASAASAGSGVRAAMATTPSRELPPLGRLEGRDDTVGASRACGESASVNGDGLRSGDGGGGGCNGEGGGSYGLGSPVFVMSQSFGYDADTERAIDRACLRLGLVREVLWDELVLGSTTPKVGLDQSRSTSPKEQEQTQLPPAAPAATSTPTATAPTPQGGDVAPPEGTIALAPIDSSRGESSVGGKVLPLSWRRRAGTKLQRFFWRP